MKPIIEPIKIEVKTVHQKHVDYKGKFIEGTGHTTFKTYQRSDQFCTYCGAYGVWEECDTGWEDDFYLCQVCGLGFYIPRTGQGDYCCQHLEQIRRAHPKFTAYYDYKKEQDIQCCEFLDRMGFSRSICRLVVV